MKLRVGFYKRGIYINDVGTVIFDGDNYFMTKHHTTGNTKSISFYLKIIKR